MTYLLICWSEHVEDSCSVLTEHFIPESPEATEPSQHSHEIKKTHSTTEHSHEIKKTHNTAQHSDEIKKTHSTSQQMIQEMPPAMTQDMMVSLQKSYTLAVRHHHTAPNPFYNNHSSVPPSIKVKKKNCPVFYCNLSVIVA